MRCDVEDYALSSFIYWGTWGRNYDTYLELEWDMKMRFAPLWSAWIRAFKWCSFCCRLNFDPKLWKTMDYSLWLSAIFGKNVTGIKKSLLGHHLKTDHYGTIPSFISHSHTKIQRVFLWIMIGCLQYCDQQEWNFPFCYSSAPKDNPEHWRHPVISQTFMWIGVSEVKWYFSFIWSNHKDSILFQGRKR